MNFFTLERRKYIADLLARVVEFIVSLLIIGRIVAAKITPTISWGLRDFILPVLFAVIIGVIGVFITPSKGEE